MLQLQSFTHSYYDSMQSTFASARESVNQQLIVMNTAALTEITEGDESLIRKISKKISQIILIAQAISH